MISVSDKGHGLTDELLTKVCTFFERFGYENSAVSVQVLVSDF